MLCILICMYSKEFIVGIHTEFLFSTNGFYENMWFINLFVYILLVVFDLCGWQALLTVLENHHDWTTSSLPGNEYIRILVLLSTQSLLLFFFCMLEFHGMFYLEKRFHIYVKSEKYSPKSSKGNLKRIS